MDKHVSHTRGQYGSHADWLLKQLSPSSLDLVADIDDDLTRWLLQCPPRHAVQVYGYPSTAAAGAAFNNPIQVAQQAGQNTYFELQAHKQTLQLLFKVCTRLPGITRHHNPQYLIRDIEVLKRRVLLSEQLSYRLAQIQQRDQIVVGTQIEHTES